MLAATTLGATSPGDVAAASANVPAPPADAERSLGAFLDAAGHLQLPPGFSGSVNPAGYRVISGEGEALRFAPESTNGSPGDGWTGFGGIGNGCNGKIVAAAIGAAGEVYFGGHFTLCGNALVNKIARFDASTQTWASLGSGAANGVSYDGPSGSTSSEVNAIAVSGNMVYAGGLFNKAGGAPANFVARFDTSTQTWASLGSGAANGVNNPVSALAVSGITVYVGGAFTQAGGALANKVASFDTSTQNWASLGSGVTSNGGSVLCLTVSGSTLYVGGGFSQAGGAQANNVASFDTSTQTWASLGSGAANGVNNTVYALAVSGSTVYAGGFFTQSGGVPANRVGRFDTSTQTWASLGSGAANGVINTLGSTFVRSFTVSGSTLYVGGNFNQAGGLTANRVARFDTSTQTWASLGSGAANGVSGVNGVSFLGVYAFAVSGSTVYAGGDFRQAGGVPANWVGRFDTSTQTWASLGTSAAPVNGSVFALAVSGSAVYVGGEFTEAGGMPANRVARFDTSTQTWASLGSGAAKGVKRSV
jgi:hypothetical protein